MSKIRKGDTVQVLAGKDLGKTGKVLRMVKDGQGVIVEKANMVKRHTKARRQNEPSGIIEKEAPLHISNVGLVSPTTGKPVRVGFKMVDTPDGPKKVRVVHKTGEQLDPA